MDNVNVLIEMIDFSEMQTKRKTLQIRKMIDHISTQLQNGKKVNLETKINHN
jgi:hypothetical protein